jgi:hypothetical protein
MGILVILAIPVVLALAGTVAGQAGTARRGDRIRRLGLPPLWPRKGPCFGEPTREGGRSCGGRPGELFHRDLAGDREYLR